MDKNAFTLIEIIVVSIIVGILALIAVPSFSKMINGSYASDAMFNLIAIYGAEQNYYHNNNDTYPSSCDFSCINNASTGLGLNIVTPVNGTTYNCPNNSICTATAGANAGSSFTLQISLTNPVTVISVPVYCPSGNSNSQYNPCCQWSSGKVAGNRCP